MESVENALGSSERAEKTSALRSLLVQPLILARKNPEIFQLIVRHRLWLTEWFANSVGWRLRVDSRAGMARLFKIPGRIDHSHPASLAGKPPFNRRRYALLCLMLSVLDGEGNQTTLQILAEQLEFTTQGRAEVEAFDPTLTHERRAFVDALRWLLDHGILVLRDGSAEGYIQSREGNALFDINHGLIASLLSCPLPPVLAGIPEMLSQETYAETEEGRRLRARHTVLRRLLDEPVLYYEDLKGDQSDWLDHSRGFVYRLLESDLGLQVERRREGLLAADPSGELSDTSFPEAGSTVKHAALLLAERLAKLHRPSSNGAATPNGIAPTQVTLWVEGLLKRYGKVCGWSQEYTASTEGSQKLASEAMEVLAAFRLVKAIEEGGWCVLPAIARYAPQEPERKPPKKPRQEELF